MNKIKSSIISVFLIVFSFSIFAGQPAIVSVVMSPSNPAFGDQVQIDVTYCGDLYLDHMISMAFSTTSAATNADLSGYGQVFVVSQAGLDVATTQPALIPGSEIGWLAQANPGGGTADCSTCGGSGDGKLYTKTYNVHVPSADSFPACANTQIFLHVGMKNSSLVTGDWTTIPACQTYVSAGLNIPLLAKNFSISKRAEGVLQSAGDLVVYSIDYEYYNGRLNITDSIPGGGNLTLVYYGPHSISGGSVTGLPDNSTAGTFTWSLADRTGIAGRAKGTVWMLLRLNNSVAAGTVFTNTATGSMTALPSQNVSASITVGQAAGSLKLSADSSYKNIGDTVTYFLEYQVNGGKLNGFLTFDDIWTGTYGTLNGTGGAAVPGFDFSPQGGTEGQWVVSDACNTGDNILTGYASQSNQFPDILYNGLPMGNTMCNGIITTDVWINPTGYEGADAKIIIRSDGLALSKQYSLILSVDDYIGTNALGNVGFQRCDGPSCVWPQSTNTVAITANKWWKTKTEIAPPPAFNQYSFRAKVWAKGDPEPAAWTIIWTDPAPPAGLDCSSGAAWKPGLGEMHGASGDVSDSYNNFSVYTPDTSGNVTVWCTIPSTISWINSQPAAVKTGNLLSWNLGVLGNEGGTLTWTGQQTTCDPVSLVALIGGTAPMSTNWSNTVSINPGVLCSTITPVVTATIFGTSTLTKTPTPTYTITRTITSTVTQTVTPTITAAIPLTVSETFTQTMTWTATQVVPTETNTESMTNTPGVATTMTFTPTFTATDGGGSVTFTQTASFTATPTRTLTITGGTVTDTVTRTITLTQTSTNTPVTTSTTVMTNTLTPNPSVTVCTGATPVVLVFASYNHSSGGSVTIDITSSIAFMSAPLVAVKPHSTNPEQVFTAALVPGTSTYRIIYPKITGYGDIDTIKVFYTDVCGNSGISDGTYEKNAVMAGRECKVYRNVINPDKGDRTRCVYNLYGAGKVKIKVFNKKGGLVKEICDKTVDGSKTQDEVLWEGVNTAGKTVSSGTYVISIETDKYTEKVKIAVVR